MDKPTCLDPVKVGKRPGRRAWLRLGRGAALTADRLITPVVQMNRLCQLPCTTSRTEQIREFR
jgi:hypothetical protein